MMIQQPEDPCFPYRLMLPTQVPVDEQPMGTRSLHSLLLLPLTTPFGLSLLPFRQQQKARAFPCWSPPFACQSRLSNSSERQMTLLGALPPFTSLLFFQVLLSKWCSGASAS